MTRLLASWTRIGVPAELAPHRARYIVLTNTAALIGLVLAAIYLPVIAFTATLALAGLTALQLPLWALPLVLNHIRRPWLATSVLMLSALSISASQVLLYGPQGEHRMFMMTAAVAPFLLFGPEHRVSSWTFAAIGGGALIVIEIFGDRIQPIYGLGLDPVLVSAPVIFGAYVALVALGFYGRRVALRAEADLLAEHDKSERLLLNILPGAVARRLKEDDGVIAEHHQGVSVLFADIVGFTPVAQQLPPGQLVAELDEVFSHFDQLADELGCEKIKTIGDAYMVAAGLPIPRPDHAAALARMALRMRDVLTAHSGAMGRLQMRIGIHSGPVVAGVIGRRRFAYDMWGDTVNTASRLESHGEAGRIHISGATRELLGGEFEVESRGPIELKGKGPMPCYWLIGTT